MGKTLKAYSSLSDNDLAELVKTGNNPAFDELVRRYRSTISFIAKRFSAQGYEESDFVQEGLVGLLYSCRTFDNDGAASFKSYMSVVVERRFISIIRRSNASRAIPSSSLVNIDDVCAEVKDSAQNPEELIECREQLDSLFDKLRAMLSHNEYKVLMLYCGGLSYNEIAAKLSITPKSADNAMQRVRRKIRFHNTAS